MAKDVIKSIPLITFNSLGLTGAYQSINPGGLPYACVALTIKNYSDATVLISYDGQNSHEVLYPNYTVKIDFQRHARPHNWVAMVAKGTGIYVKDGGPAKGGQGGNIYLTGWYLE